MDARVKAVVAGSLFISFCSLAPLLAFYNIFCGAWIVFGGILTVFIYKRGSDGVLDYSRGVSLAIVTGIISAMVVCSVKLFALFLVGGNRFFSGEVPGMSMFFVRESESLLSIMVFTLVVFFVFILFASVGGAFGVLMFGRMDLKNSYNYDTNYVRKLKKERG